MSKKKIQSSKADKIFNAVNYTLLGIVLLCVLYPLYFIVIASFSDPTMVNTGQTLLLPKGINIDGYKRILEYDALWSGYRNTIFYTVVATTLNIIVTMMFAYPLSRKNFSGKKALTFYLLITMYFNGGMIPTYLVVQSLGLYNTPWVLILMGMVNGFNVIVARTFLASSIPEELYEAAIIDGCSHARFFWQIVCPLSKAIIAVLVLYYGIAHWNEYMNALIYISDEKYQPLQIVLRNILLQAQMDQSLMLAEDAVLRQQETEIMKYALIIVATVPVMIIYPFLQKYFVQGIMIGSVKG